MTTDTQTDAGRIAELRAVAAEAQAARRQVIGEIAHLTTTLRQAQAERDEYRSARDRAEKMRADDYRQQTETVRALIEQRDAACKELSEMRFAREVALALARNMTDERDAARADAERMFYAIKAFMHSRQGGNTGLSEYDRIIRELEESSATHAVAISKAEGG